MPDSTAALAVRLLRAKLENSDYPPPGIQDTPQTRELWDAIGRELADMKDKGISPHVPWDYNED